MEDMINNLINGNLSDAKRQALKYSVKKMKEYLMEELGWDALKAFRACRYLKFPSQHTFNLWCESSKN
jgi:hypothetical protein